MKAVRSIAVVSLLLVSATHVAADTYPRQPGVDALHYAFRLTLNDDNDEISGEAAVDLRFDREGLGQFTLDLASATENGRGMIVTDVSCGGTAAQFTHANDQLKITVDPAVTAGEQRQFTVRYHGVPANGLRIGENKFDERTFFQHSIGPTWPGNGCR